MWSKYGHILAKPALCVCVCTFVCLIELTSQWTSTYSVHVVSTWWLELAHTLPPVPFPSFPHFSLTHISVTPWLPVVSFHEFLWWSILLRLAECESSLWDDIRMAFENSLYVILTSEWGVSPCWKECSRHKRAGESHWIFFINPFTL